jgi:hypothetical protein
VLERTQSEIVLTTSTWRYDPAGLFSPQYWRIPFIDITPDLPDQPRRNEIVSWLSNHPAVTRYAVLDDEDDELDGLPLFQPSSLTGLTDGLRKVLWITSMAKPNRICARLGWSDGFKISMPF